MKKQKIILLIVILLLCLIVISIILNQNRNIKKETKIIKEMSESTQVSDLQTQINQLNASHTEYANYVQSCKEAIATAITNQGVTTSADATAEVMAENIGKILQAKTTATATAAQILKGQTAWINGSKVTGTMTNNGAVTASLNAGGSYTIPEGYHNGSGKVTANSLASQTSATAVADNITEGKTAWVNGKLITGTGADNKSYYTPTFSIGRDTLGKRQLTNVTYTTKAQNTLVILYGGGDNGGVFTDMTISANNSTIERIYTKKDRGTFDGGCGKTIGCYINKVNAPIGTVITVNTSTFMYDIYIGVVFIDC